MTTNTNSLRFLSKCEVLYDNEMKHGNLIITRAFLLQINPDYKIDLIKLKETCSYWTKMNPFLRSFIKTIDKSKMIKQFEEFEEKTYIEFENVQIVNHDQKSWQDVMYEEIRQKFDSDKILWRLKFVKMNENNLDHNHVLILSSHHSIGDGRCIYELGVQFLDILCSVLKNEFCPEMSSASQDSKENSDQIIDQLYPHPLVLNYTEIERRNRFSIHLINKDQVSSSMFKYFYLSKECVNGLKKASKSYNATLRLTSVISSIVCLALRNLYKSKNVTDIPTESLNYLLLASLRDKLRLKNIQMGVYSTALEIFTDLRKYPLHEIDNKEKNYASVVWKMARDEMSKLDDALSKNQDIGSVRYVHETIEQIEKMCFKDNLWNFQLSNVGIMGNTRDLNTIKIVEHYPRMVCIKNRYDSTLFIGISTVNERMCWSFSYDEKIVSSRNMDIFIENIKNIIQKLTKNVFSAY
jgi:hypothetical protein